MEFTRSFKNLIIIISGSVLLGLIMARLSCPYTDLLPAIMR